jgi:hypothetical protein
MKKLLFAFTAVALTFTACKKDETDDIIINENPIVAITPLTGTIVEAGSTISLAISVRANANGDKLKTVALTDPNDFSLFLALDVNETSLDTVVTFVVSSSFKTSVYSLIANDKKDHLASATISIITNDGFGEDLTGAIYHINGGDKGSYDFINDARVSANLEPDSIKDMRNTDVTGAFNGTWTSQTDTRYVIASMEFAEITKTQAETSFSSGVQSQTVIPTVGSVYIAKLRDGVTMMKMEVLSIDDTNNDCDCTDNETNYGKMSFKYKKM